MDFKLELFKRTDLNENAKLYRYPLAATECSRDWEAQHNIIN